mgnify:CR=1 FL=1
MKTNIESLVEEALKKLAGSNLGETYTKFYKNENT